MFSLRRTDFHGVREVAGRSVKVYAISADGAATSAEVLDSACGTAASVLPGGGGSGFVVVHRGEEAVWLLVHWWEDDILCQRLFRDGPGGEFVPAEPQLFACVWELHVIDHERRSWALRVLGEDDVDGYLGDGISVAGGAPLVAP
ncbi:hypothetical protein [Saccharopolyspora griseoalba]|uniref:Antibiotic biosynthesis monooxygenase n=1 Tax=Saccharopolyspora griseoalba TaxID=1431848 RepID=A0ABW2LP39_9PSEU